MIEVHKYLNVGKAVVIEKERLYRANRRYDSVTESRVIKEVVNSGRAFRGATRDLVRAADLGREHHFIRAGDVSRIPKFNPVTEFTARRKDLRAPAEVARISNNPTSKTSTKVVGPVPSFANSRTDQGNKRGLPEAPRIHAPARDLGSTGITKSSQPITQKGEAKSTPLAKTQTTTQNASQSPDAALAKRGELRERMTGRSDKTVLEKTQVSGTAGATRTATAPSSKSSTMAQTAPYRQQQLALAQQQQQAEAQRLAITQRREQQLRLARQQQVQRSHRQVTPTTTGHTVQHQSEKPKSNAGLKTK